MNNVNNGITRLRKWKLDNGKTKVEIKLDDNVMYLIIDEKTGKVYSGNENDPSIYNDFIKIFTNEKAEIHSTIGPAIIHQKKNIRSFYLNSNQLTEKEFLQSPEVMNFTKNLIDLDATKKKLDEDS